MERLKECDADLAYRCGKGHGEPLQSVKTPSELVLTPLDLANRSAPDYPDDQLANW